MHLDGWKEKEKMMIGFTFFSDSYSCSHKCLSYFRPDLKLFLDAETHLLVMFTITWCQESAHIKMAVYMFMMKLRRYGPSSYIKGHP